MLYWMQVLIIWTSVLQQDKLRDFGNCSSSGKRYFCSDWSLKKTGQTRTGTTIRKQQLWDRINQIQNYLKTSQSAQDAQRCRLIITSICLCNHVTLVRCAFRCWLGSQLELRSMQVSDRSCSTKIWSKVTIFYDEVCGWSFKRVFDLLDEQRKRVGTFTHI